MLTRFWIEFSHREVESGVVRLIPPAVGVTAHDLSDAKALIQSWIQARDFPEIKKVIENIKYEDLEQNHVQMNMGSMAVRGIWYPQHNIS